MIVTFRGFEYLPVQRAGALVLIKAAKYDRTQVRKDEKGRSWVFNNETSRWRIQRDGQDAPAAKTKKEAPPVDAKPKSSTPGLTRRIGSALKNGPAHIDALHQHLSKRSPIDKADLGAHIQGLVKRGKLFDHGDGKFGREPGAPAAPKSAPSAVQKNTPEPAANPQDALRDRYREDVKGTDLLPFDEASKKLKKLGEGVDGVVFAQGNLALKYLQGTRKFDGAIIDNLTAAGDLGIAPKIHGVNKNMNILSMQLLKGYQTLSSEDGDDDIQSDDGSGTTVLKNLIRITQKAHENGWMPDDVHATNVMFHPGTKDVLFVDQGEMVKNPSSFEKAQQLLDSNYYRPLIAESVQQLVSTVSAKDARELKKLRKRYEQAKDNDRGHEQGLTDFYGKVPPKTPDSVYQKLVKDTYTMLAKHL